MSGPTVSRAARIFTWLGCAAFVASLGYFIFFYTVTLDVALPFESTAAIVRAIAVDAVLFTLFALHHSILARPPIRQAVRANISPTLERALYVWVASALFALVCFSWIRIPAGFVLIAEGPLLWIVRTAQFAGVALIVLAARSIDPLELAGVRQLHGPRQPTDTAGVSRTFPYNLVRHPMYLGWMLTTLGTSPMTADRLLFAGIGALYLVVAIPWEERALVNAFGDAYVRYQATVSARLIPRIW